MATKYIYQLKKLRSITIKKLNMYYTSLLTISTTKYFILLFLVFSFSLLHIINKKIGFNSEKFDFYQHHSLITILL